MRKDAPRVSYALTCALLALALAIPVAGAAPRPVTLGAIEGQVFSPTGFATEGARVSLQASDGTGPHSTVTNAQGRFRFPMLAAGLYDVRASSKGQSSEWRHNVAVRTGHPTIVTLHLQPKKPAPKNPGRS